MSACVCVHAQCNFLLIRSLNIYQTDKSGICAAKPNKGETNTTTTYTNAAMDNHISTKIEKELSICLGALKRSQHQKSRILFAKHTNK